MNPGIGKLCQHTALALLLLAPTEARAADDSSATAPGPRTEMRQVFEAISRLLPISLSEADWADPARRTEIQRWLDALTARSSLVEEHGMMKDAGFRHLSRSLSSDIEEVRERFRAGRYEESRFFMIQATGNCVACHSRLPSSDSDPMADRLIGNIDFDKLSTHEQTQILVATRQFDRALLTWEKMFEDRSITPGEFDLGGYLLDYMTIGLRVLSDPDRVRKTLERLSARPDIPLYLHRHLVGWIRALQTTAVDLQSHDRLERARALVLGRQAPSPTPLGREQTVYDLVASSLLLQLLSADDTEGIRRAEAYYLLGLVESRTIDSHWVPQAEVHLEAAIRLAPDAPFAEDAYAVLEEYIIIGWGGASNTDLPADEWTKLRELRQLIDDQADAGSGEAAKRG